MTSMVEEQQTATELKPKSRPTHSRRKSTAHQGERFDDFIRRLKEEEEQELSRVSIYTTPLVVVGYFAVYIFYEIQTAVRYLVKRTYLTATVVGLFILILVMYQLEGFHQIMIELVKDHIAWYGWWLLLGIASSIGLGTGLHTFVLFLGPHVAEVTVTAYQCGNTAFASRGPNRFICYDNVTRGNITFWDVFFKVWLESFLWGAGTALGELPPYFVARAAALSGGLNEDMIELNTILTKSPEKVSKRERLLIFLHDVIQRLGFLGILICASIPNPLFDLAGITCGHFLVPFSTFFGATFIGKAVIKASLQVSAMIVVFSADTLEMLLTALAEWVPVIYMIVGDTIREHSKHLHRTNGKDDSDSPPNLIGLIWNTILFLMLSYFVLSTIESLAKSQIKRVNKQRIHDYGK